MTGTELAALGPYFAVELLQAEADPPWRPMSELVDGREVLADRIAGVRSSLANGTGQDASGVELRVAASVVHLGLMARILSPLLALAVLHRRSGHVRAADLYWQPMAGSMFPLAVRAQALDCDFDVDAEFAIGAVVSEVGAATAAFGVNDHILRGNVASALAGAGKMLTAARPERRDDIRTLIERLLETPQLSGSGGFTRDGSYRRRSCCLIYRAAPDHRGALCGDCALAPARGPMKR